MKIQNQFLDAVQDGELGRARLLGVELARMATEKNRGAGEPLGVPASPSPSIASTISTTSTTATTSSKVDTKLSLDSFQEKYTSEDNASFSAILNKNNEERKARYQWVFDKELNQLRLTGGEGNGDVKAIENGERPNVVQEWKYSARNSLMYVPEGEPLSAAEIGDARGPPKSITHNATRFPSTSTQQILDTARAAETRIHTQEVWKDMAKATPALWSQAEGRDSPRVRGFGFVSSTPSPAPHRDVDPSDLMTWGIIEGTPLLVDSGADHSGTGPAFKIPPTPRREAIGMRLSEKASRNMRERATGRKTFASTPGTPAGWTPTHHSKRISSPVVRTAMLSPAAKRLLKQSKSAVAMGGGDMQLRASYSATPTRISTGGSIRSGSVTPRGFVRARSLTPMQVDRTREDTIGPEVSPPNMNGGRRDSVATIGSPVSTRGGSITDNLLDI
ncbi:DiGeorge syndrome critical region protein 14 [Borealophlyctis nickersoniae]|nr:DiGeorge syndrome critical region protein 14 [Borealophlyctis nickersoniae]